MIGQVIYGLVYRNMGFCFDYGFSRAIHLATFTPFSVLFTLYCKKKALVISAV